MVAVMLQDVISTEIKKENTLSISFFEWLVILVACNVIAKIMWLIFIINQKLDVKVTKNKDLLLGITSKIWPG